MTDRDKVDAFLVGFIIGGLAGAIVALLITPRSGEETRSLIRDRSIMLREAASHTAAEARARAVEPAAEASEPSGSGEGRP